jgi:microcystin-dependent protein
MSSPYIGEIRLFAGNFAPVGWAFCNGQTIAISENDTLFNLIGTTYGGDGQSTFNLPNLQSRVPLHMGGGYTIGESGGVESVTLTTQTLPAHSHPWLATTSAAQNASPEKNAFASGTATVYSNAAPNTPMNNGVVGFFGGSQPHDNIQPYICINYIISLYGIYPTQG